MASSASVSTDTLLSIFKEAKGTRAIPDSSPDTGELLRSFKQIKLSQASKKSFAG
jgi:hypothetical protein